MKLHRKSRVAILLLMLAFNLTATTLAVQADAGGTGKFLTIGIVGEGNVTATKVKSGEAWNFTESGTEKVGAGTIRLEVFADPGWEFYRWEGDLSGNSTTTEYKTEKYGNVTAVFVKITYTITATAFGPGTINGTELLEVEVEHGGASPTFVFAPENESYHITSIKVDNNYTGYTTSYAFPDPITSDHTIVVTFDDIGVATVPSDINVESFIDSILSVMFNETEGGTLFGTALPLPEGMDLFLYEITTNATDADGWILLALQLNGLWPVNVTVGETADAVCSDVNFDYQVDGTDVSLVANAVKSTTGSGVYLAEYDVNRDGVVNEEDVKTVNENKGATLTAPEWWIKDGILYVKIENNDWSVFRWN